MRLRLGIACILLLLLSTAAFAVPTRALVLQDESTATEISVLSASDKEILLQLDLSSLEVEDLEIAGQSWQRLSIPGGALSGQDGQAALPIFGKLVAIPAGTRASLEILDFETRDFNGWRLAPAAPREGEEAFVDSDWYATKGASHSFAGLGQAATLRDLRVVPLTFSPVAYDPSTDTITAATRVRVAIRLSPDASPDAQPRLSETVTPSFDTLYKERVLNYASGSKTLAVEPGSYLVIYPNNATVLANLQPLLEWRREQGYNVVVASTASTGTSSSQIKSYIQTQYNTLKPALEHVVLVGDAGGSVSIPTFYESLSGYGGEGDHEYTLLDGSDVLADVHLGRLSVESTTELTTVVDKIVTYETNPDTVTDPGWFQRATLVGDEGTSGITCIFVNQWAKSQLLQHGYTQVDTVWSGNFPTEMLTRFGNGGTLFTYRGWLGMSGMSSSYIMNLTNGGELGFAVVMTCDTGSFASDGNCRSEAFLRSPTGGGVAGIGTATIGTHTRYNNCVFTGVIDHTYNSGDFRTGPALTGGKLAMYSNYFVGEPSRVEIWSTWNNLMGDPCTEIWTSFPKTFDVDYDANLAMGADAVAVTVTEPGSGLPVEGAMVSLYKSGEIRISGETDASGRAVLPIAGYSAGDLALTIRKHNVIPSRLTVVLGAATELVAFESSTVLDAVLGDGDGVLEPGEQVDLDIVLHNHGSATAPAVSAVLSSHDPWVTVDVASASFGDIASGGDVTSATSYRISVDQAAPGGHNTQLALDITSGAETWTSLVEVPVTGANLTYLASAFGGPGFDMDPGESGTLTVTLRNTGNVSGTSISGVLSTESPWVSIVDDSGDFGTIGVDGSGNNTGDSFSVSIGSDCYPGHLVAFTLQTTTAEGGQQMQEFTWTVGSPASTDPFGPDGYGYYAYDNTDTGYPEAPTYDWIEIDPTIGGSGTSVGLNDGGWEEDDTQAFSLPFDFQFYGEVYDEISICSNGWIAMGVTENKAYRNWALPTAGAPDGMIAAFWDNLFQNGATGGVFAWHDTANHRLIIEWSRMASMWSEGYTGPTQTFEVILYDPAYHPTPTGDGMIDVQYLTVNNGDSTNGYATAGLMNLDHTDGLTYEYWDTPAAGAASLTTGRAIRYLTYMAEPQGTLNGTVTNVTGGSPAEGVEIRAIQAGRSFSTIADGSYSGGLATGTYDIAAIHSSFAPDTTFGVVIIEDQARTVDFSLVDIAGPEFTEVTVLPDTEDAVGPYAVQATVVEFTGIDELTLWYMSSAGGGPAALPLTAIDAPNGVYGASIPGQPLGSSVIYWLVGSDTAGLSSSFPSDGPVGAYRFRIEDTAIASYDMEAVDGWTVDDGTDTATAGVWERVDPNAVWDNSTQITPEDDITVPGVNAWITGQDAVGANQGSNDVDGGKTTLLSPVYDLSGYATASVGYWRWYTNDTGFSPGEDWWVVQISDGGAWVDLERTQSSLRSWQYMEFAVEDYVSLTSNVQIRYIAEDAGSGSVVEAGVDEFSLSGMSTLPDSEDPTVTVVYPNGGETISPPVSGLPRAGVEAEWSASDNVGVNWVVMLYSDDSGVTWPDTLLNGYAAGAYEAEWGLLESTTTARIKVVVLDAELNAAQDESDGDFALDISTAIEDEVPQSLVLGRNVPNPFNPATKINFAVPRSGQVVLKIHDVQGRLVRTLVSGPLEAGSHSVMWRGEDDRGARAASGTYFYRLEAAGEVLTEKMTLLK